MRDLVLDNKNYKVLINGEKLPINFFEDSDFKYLKKYKLIKSFDFEDIIVDFVGDFITPSTNYISLPKKFTINEFNVKLTKKTLNKFKLLKHDGKTLVTNMSFLPDDKGDLKSDVFYFNKLKEYFLDYITYEFVYPKKMIQKHSKQPLKGKIDTIKSEMNYDRLGPGITYKIKDVKNNKEWNLDDIYYTTLVKLSDNFGSDRDKQQIKDMKKFLDEEGYEIELDNRILQEDIPTEEIIKDIKKIDVNSIHNPIKNTLIDYYQSRNIIEKYSIFAFYTKEFDYVWEYICRIVLKHDEDFKNGITLINPTTTKNRDDVGEETKLNPDIYSSYKGHLFIGDSKYYSNLDSNFHKEMHEYNEATENKYTMAVFIPSDKTAKYRIKRQNVKELIVITLSLEEVILDVINNTNITIEKVHTILAKSSRRWK